MEAKFGVTQIGVPRDPHRNQAHQKPKLHLARHRAGCGSARREGGGQAGRQAARRLLRRLLPELAMHPGAHDVVDGEGAHRVGEVGSVQDGLCA